MTPLLTVTEVAAAMQLTPKTIQVRCRERRMFPQPVSYQRPYRFSAALLQRVLDGVERAPVAPVRRGFVRRAS